MSNSTYEQMEPFFGDVAKQARLYVTLNYDGSNYTDCAHDSKTVLSHPIWALMNARNYNGFNDTEKTSGKCVLSKQFVDFIQKVAEHHRTIDQVGDAKYELEGAKNVGSNVYSAWSGLTQDARDFYEQNINFVHNNKQFTTSVGVRSESVRMNLKKHSGEKAGHTVFGHCIPQLPPNTVNVNGESLDVNHLRDLYNNTVRNVSVGGYQRGGTFAGVDAWTTLDVEKFIKAVYEAQMKSTQRGPAGSGSLSDIYYDMALDQVYSKDAAGNLQIKKADGTLVSADAESRITGVPSTIFSCILKGDPKELSRCLGEISNDGIYEAAEKEVRQMNPETLGKLLATFAIALGPSGVSEHYIEWTSNLTGRLSAKMGSDKGQKTAEAILKNKKLCNYLKRVIDLQRANPALHGQNNEELSDLPTKTLSTKSNIAYFRAPSHINRADAISRSLGLMVQNLNVLPQQNMLPMFNLGLNTNLMHSNPFVGIAGMGGVSGIPMSMGMGRQFGGAKDPQAKYLRDLYNTIKDEMKTKGKELVEEDQQRIEKAINEIEKNNSEITRALDDLRAFINLDNVVTNGLGNTVSLREIKNSTTIPNIRKSISNLESCVTRTSRDQVSLLTALIEQVYRPMLLVASGASTPFIRPYN